MDLNGVYQYAEPYRFALRAYDVQPPRPVFLLESTYEHEHPDGNTQPFRKAWWWTMLSGGAGVVWSNFFLWRCESARGTYGADYGDTYRAVSSWAAELDSPGTRQIVLLHRFFEALPWHRLVPSGRSEWSGIASGQRWGQGRSPPPERKHTIWSSPTSPRPAASADGLLSTCRAWGLRREPGGSIRSGGATSTIASFRLAPGR